MPRFLFHARSRLDAQRVFDGEVVTRSLADAEDIAFERLRRAEGIWADRWRDVFLDVRQVLVPVPIRPSAKDMIVRDRTAQADTWRRLAEQARESARTTADAFWREGFLANAAKADHRAAEHQRIADRWRSL